jgi:toxin ParE1/3/4
VSEVFEIVWSPSAIQDLDDILEYVAARRNPDAAAELYLRMVKKVETLSRSPSRARVVPELRELGVREYRELIVSPYRIPFRIRNRIVAILGVFDGRRELTELLLRRAMEPFAFE